MDTEQLERFERNIRLDGMGEDGQVKLLDSSVLIIGTGGLGSACLLYLAAAGVGMITIVDPDRVALSNLQRQVAHGSADIGRKKVLSAAEKARAINPSLTLVPLAVRVTLKNIARIASGHDFIIDATDNFAAKYLINEYCVKNKVPFTHAGVQGFSGQILTFSPGYACLSCVFGDEPKIGDYVEPSSEGVLGAVAGFAGTMQAAEAVKFITGVGELLTGMVYSFDMRYNRHKIIKTDRRANCPVCGKKD